MVAVVAIALLGLSLGAESASAAARPRIVTPSATRVVGGPTVRVRVRVRGAAHGFRVYLGSKDVSKRFGKAKDGMRTARLRRGHDFKNGANRLVLQVGMGAGRRYASRVFIAARPAKFLRLRRLRGRGALAPVDFRLNSSTSLGHLRVSLNGHRVRQFDLARRLRGGGRSFRLPLGADDGLRYGGNELVVQGVGAGGKRFQRLVRQVRVPRSSRPLPGAGPDLRGVVGRSIAIDGGSTLRASRGDRLHYGWRILSAPPGSKAKLSGDASRTGHLVPDRPGRYQLQLVATADGGAPRPVAGTAARASAVTPPASAAPSASDVRTIEVTPPTPPIGLPIETIANGGISLGGNVLGTTASWLQVVALDRSTLQVVQNESIGLAGESIGPQQIAELGAMVGRLGPNDLVVISGGGRAVSLSETGVFSALAQELQVIGVDADPLPESQPLEEAVAQGKWSAIGVPGSAVGSGAVNLSGATMGGLGDSVPVGAPGSLQGYLQMDVPAAGPDDPAPIPSYIFVSPDHAGIDTLAVGSTATSNNIEIGGTPYKVEGLPSGGAGFQLLVLNSRLQEVSNRSFLTNDPGGAADSGGPAELAATLAALAQSGTPGDLVVLQSIGSPSGRNTYWNYDTGVQSFPWGYGNTVEGKPIPNEYSDWGSPSAGYSIAAQIGRLAGPAAHDQFAQMIGTSPSPQPADADGYTLIAPLGDPADAISQSQAGSGLESAQVVGTLTRARDSSWTVEDASASGTYSSESVLDVAYQPTVAWPDSTTAGDHAANAYIAQELGLTQGSNGVTEVRQAYYLDDTDDWATLESELERLTYPGSGNGFTMSTFNALKHQLEIEFPYVGGVRNMVAQWEHVFPTARFSGYVDLQKIASEVEGQIESDIASRKAGLNTKLIIAHSFGIAAGLVGLSGIGPLAAPLTATSGAFLLAGDLSQEGNGSLSALPVSEEAANLGVALAQRYEQIENSLPRIGDLLVSDWGKLETAGKDANGAWSLNSQAQQTLTTALTVGANRESFSSLLPLAYGEYLLSPLETGRNQPPTGEPWNYSCLNDSQPPGNTQPLSGAQGNPGSWIDFPYGLAGDAGNGFTSLLQPRVMAIEADLEMDEEEKQPQVIHEPRVIPASIAGRLFKPLSDGGYGVDQVALFGDPAFARWPLYC
jgi:hypothetical protein